MASPDGGASATERFPNAMVFITLLHAGADLARRAETTIKLGRKLDVTAQSASLASRRDTDFCKLSGGGRTAKGRWQEHLHGRRATCFSDRRSAGPCHSRSNLHL